MLLQKLLHFDVADADSRFHLALAHAGQQQLIAQLFAEGRQGHAILLQTLAQGFARELVAAGHVGLGLVQSLLVDRDACIAGLLDLGLVIDELFQRQPFGLGGVERSALRLRFALQAIAQVLHFLVGDGLDIDHSDDEVCRTDGRRARSGSGRALGRHSQRQPGRSQTDRGAGGAQSSNRKQVFIHSAGNGSVQRWSLASSGSGECWCAGH